MYIIVKLHKILQKKKKKRKKEETNTDIYNVSKFIGHKTFQNDQLVNATRYNFIVFRAEKC